MKLHDFENTETVLKLLGGYSFDPEATGTAALQDAKDMDSAGDAVVEVIEEFVRVETMFDGKLTDVVVHQMTKDNAESLDTVIATNLPIIYLVVY